MYPEFIAIYVSLGILAAMMVAVIVLLFILIRKVSSGSPAKVNSVHIQGQNNDNTSQSSASFNVAFCSNCGTRYDAQTRVCPKCGTPR